MRCANTDTLLPTNGSPKGAPVFVKQGTNVSYSIYAMHRRPDLYVPDAITFRPERWEEPMPLNIDPINAKWGFLPFGGGSRSCLGTKFAMSLAGFTLVRLLQKFPDLSIPSSTVPMLVGVEKQTLRLALSIRDGCIART